MSNAIAAAVAKGQRQFKAVCVVGFDDQFLYPCGVCRQKLAEFAPDILVIAANAKGAYQQEKLSNLLPKVMKL